ncbi:MAG TPA: sugar O-acetyltransferase [Gemmatimonadales bacterium]|nr:sugar O-acetyltransferase [Gemmatimonadales bacterium]
MTSERERMLRGEFYDPRDPELLALAHRARRILARYNASDSSDGEARRALLEELFGGVGSGVWIEPPFFCDYGANVVIGPETFLNVNCVILDSAAISIGARVLVGPGVQILTATHPVRSTDRIPMRLPGEVTAPYRTRAAPIRIGDRVWLGAGAIVLPGVTIGDDTTIGAGSLVTGDIPPGVLAFGQPCRVQREL